jgi:outer membrane protein OmpA-like peptidoglycan-associated protein
MSKYTPVKLITQAQAVCFSRKMLLPVAVTALAACASVPQPQELTDVENRLDEVMQNEQVSEYAPVELQEATEMKSALSSYWQKEQEINETFEHKKYLTNRAIDIAEMSGELGALNDQLAKANKERTELILASREAQIEKAKLEAKKTQNELTQLQSQFENFKAEQSERGLVLTVEGVLFDFDKAQLKAGGIRDIKRLAEYLKNNPNTSIKIEGHTDSMGSAEYNEQLAKQRAMAVQRELTKMDVIKDRLEVVSHGEMYPVATNDTAEGRQQNRRVEIILTD